MKAVLYRKSKGLVVEEIPTPSPGKDEVLVKVVNSGFCGSDHSMLESGGLADGSILGHEASGVVVEVGKNAADVEIGARVIIRPTFCGQCRECLMGKPYLCQVNRRSIGIGDLPGAFAEYIKVFPKMLIPVPEAVDFPNAALAEAFAASLHGIRCSRQSEGSVLVIGGGPIGLALIQLLKLHNFGPIVLSEPQAERRELGRVFGADSIVDPFSDAFGKDIFESSRGLGFDTVFECSGSEKGVQTAMDFAGNGGTICLVGMILKDINFKPFIINFKETWLTASYSNTHEENIQCLKWMAEKKLDGTKLISDLITPDQLPEVYKERIHTGKALKVMLDIG